MQQTVLRALLRGEMVDMNHEGEMKEQAITLLQKGLLLLDDNGSFRFPSPLHEWHYRKQVIHLIDLLGAFVGSSGISPNRATCMICVCSSTVEGLRLSTSHRLVSILFFETASRG